MTQREFRLPEFSFCLLSFVLVDCVYGFHSGAPCSAQYTMSPSAIFHGAPQNTQTRPPPYRFEVVDLQDRPVKNYKAQLYKIRLTGSTPFRGFLIQVRPSSKEGYPIGHLRAGEFAPDSTWSSQGVRVQPCPSTFNDSVTHARNDDKTALEVLWKATKNYGPVLFVITIVQTRSVFWTQWLPPTGFLSPDESDLKASSENEREGRTDNPFVQKGLRVVVKPRPNGEIQPTDEGRARPLAASGSRPPTAIGVNTGPIQVSGGLSRITPEIQLQEITTVTAPSSDTSSTRTLFELRTVAPTNLGSLPERTISTTTASNAGTISPEILEGLQILKGKNETDFCADFPCYNNATCKNVPAEDRYQCLCTSRWIGKQCDIENFCEHHQCKNGGECINGDDGYKCKCKREWAGEFCESDCPSAVCDNGGTCILADGAHKHGCVCAPGWTGEKCGQELDLCQSQPCQHGGTCIRKFNGFSCKCTNGYMGSACHRPCQDIYGSCSIWNEEKQCESMRASTKFFDVNCAATCKQCIFDNRTLGTEVPLPPVLEAFDFILGRWTLNSSAHQRFPLDFSINSTSGYVEEIVFKATPAPMFGTPSVNYSAIARNNLDHDDVHVSVGFLTLKPLTKPLKISLMSTGNHGITTIEEGVLNGTEFNLTTQYFAILPSIDSKAPALVKRSFAVTNEMYLRETVERLGNNGHTDYFTKYYFKEKKFSPF